MMTLWILFAIIVTTLLTIDLFLFGKKDLSMGTALTLSAFYMSMGIMFGGVVAYSRGWGPMWDYMTAFLVEKSLSLDNIFVISVIFTSLSIPKIYQHRVLFWGILGVIILRGLMIVVGAELLHRFEWILYIFAVLMIMTGIKLFFMSTKAPDIKDNTLIQKLKRYLPLTNELHGHNFFVYLKNTAKKGKKKLFMTPLLLALITIELADLMFAIDSVPAVFVITQDPFIVYTCNILQFWGCALFTALLQL